jgi:hypothetical protein
MPPSEVRHQNMYDKLAFRFWVIVFAFWLLPSSYVFGQEQAETSIRILATFDYPGAIYTTCNGINDRGDVVGSFYNDIDFTFRGFVRSRDGRFSDPIEGPDNPDYTYATDIGSTPTVCGYIWDTVAGVFQGYFLHGGNFRFYNVEGAASTSIGGMNSAGHFAGSYGLFAYGDDGCYINANGQITTFSIPGASYHRVTAINNADMVVGWYVITPTVYHGFFRDAVSGEVTYLDFPGSVSTLVTGINDHGVMVGWYWDPNYDGHGFVFKPGASESFLSYDYPSTPESETHFGGINNRGLICGDYDDVFGNHGFVAKIR